jgi:signal transduction histidine kinase
VVGAQARHSDVAAGYADESREAVWRGATTYAILAAALVVATTPFDYVLFPSAVADLRSVRITGLVALLVALGLLQTRPGRRHPHAFAFAMVAGIGVMLQALALPTGGHASPYHLVMLFVILSLAVVIPWGAWWSGLAFLLLLGEYVLATFALPQATPAPSFVTNLLVLSATSVFAVVGAGLWSRLRRREFMQRAATMRAIRDASENALRLRTVMANAPIVLFAMNREGIVTLNEGRGLERVRMMPDAILGRHFADVIREMSGQAEELLPRYEQALAGTPGSWTIEFGGAIFDVRMEPLTDAHGTQTGAIGLAVDVTDLVKAQEARRATERRLVESQRLESLGALAAGIAHDFNNVLVGVLGNASLMQTDLPADSPLAQYARDIEEAARHASDLTRQLLAYAGKGTLQVEKIDVNALLDQMQGLLLMSTGNVRLRLDLGPDVRAVDADRTQLRQMVTNLVLNAAEAIGDAPGGTTLRTRLTWLSREDCDAMQHPPAAPGAYVLLEVIDAGVGMDTETITKICNPFFSTKLAGRGLGLATVLGVVRAHQGGLSIRSAPGAGTTFGVFLPVGNGGDAAERPLRNATGPAATAARTAPGPLQGRTVLLVDDDRSVRTVTTKMLEQLGCTVLSATDGDEGVSVFRDNVRVIDASIVDLTLPNMDGEEAFQAMRAIRPDAPIILTSGCRESEAVERLLAHGLRGFLGKPFSKDELRTALERLTAPE